MSLNYNFSAPSYVIFGNGERKNVGELLNKWAKPGNVMLICDENIIKAGLSIDVTDSINAAGMNVILFDKVKAEAPVEIVREGITLAKQNNLVAIVVIGGGSAMDIGKAIALMLENEGDILDYCKEQEAFINRKNIPLIVLPTTCGTGSEMTDGGVIYDNKTQYKYGFWDVFAGADVAIIDVFMIKNLPLPILTTTSLDALSHSIESYTNVNPNPIADALALESIRLIAKYLPVAFSKPGDQEALEYLFSASTMAGMSFNRTGVHVGHSAGQSLGTLTNIPHGLSCALFLPYVVSSQVNAIPERIANIGMAMGLDIPKNSTASEIGIIVSDNLTELIRELNIPTLKSLNIDPDIFDDFAEYALNEPFQASAPCPSTKDDLCKYWDSPSKFKKRCAY